MMLLSVAASAQELSTDRPDQTEAPFVIPYRTVQIESGLLHVKESVLIKKNLPSVLWRISLSEIMEMRIITTHARTRLGTHVESGIEPVEFGFKLKVCSEKGIRPNIGFIQHVAIPGLASENLKASNYVTNFRFAAQHTMSEKINLSYNAGMEWEPGLSEAGFIYTLAVGFGITGKLSGFAELFGIIPEKDKSIHSFDGGFTYLLLPNLQLDVSAGAGFKNTSEDYFIGTGISWRFPTAKNSKYQGSARRQKINNTSTVPVNVTKYGRTDSTPFRPAGNKEGLHSPVKRLVHLGNGLFKLKIASMAQTADDVTCIYFFTEVNG